MRRLGHRQSERCFTSGLRPCLLDKLRIGVSPTRDGAPGAQAVQIFDLSGQQPVGAFTIVSSRLPTPNHSWIDPRHDGHFGGAVIHLTEEAACFVAGSRWRGEHARHWFRLGPPTSAPQAHVGEATVLPTGQRWIPRCSADRRRSARSVLTRRLLMSTAGVVFVSCAPRSQPGRRPAAFEGGARLSAPRLRLSRNGASARGPPSIRGSRRLGVGWRVLYPSLTYPPSPAADLPGYFAVVVDHEQARFVGAPAPADFRARTYIHALSAWSC